GRKRGIPVVLDLHENFPAAIRSWGFDHGIVGKYFYDLNRWRELERRSVLDASGVVVVVEEALERLVGYGMRNDHSEVVMNAERLTFGEAVTPVDPGADPPLRLLYIGGLGPHRGITTAIRAVARVAGRISVHLRLVGDGKVRAELEALTRELNVSSHVTFTGWIPLSQVPGEIAASHVGLVPHVRSDHTETTIPHKLFQCMTLGRPVLVSDCRPIARIVRELNCGLVHGSDDDSEMARLIEKLQDPELRRSLGAAGRSGAQARYNWESEGRRLASFYDRILKTAGP
ncbi:MAG: glycosyltransferase, partial [Deltaproteobacteria bacterium]|nr:glycosyltransferase [Deltaproteobacteria bacterium]